MLAGNSVVFMTRVMATARQNAVVGKLIYSSHLYLPGCFAGLTWGLSGLTAGVCTVYVSYFSDGALGMNFLRCTHGGAGVGSYYVRGVASVVIVGGYLQRTTDNLLTIKNYLLSTEI